MFWDSLCWSLCVRLFHEIRACDVLRLRRRLAFHGTIVVQEFPEGLGSFMHEPRFVVCYAELDVVAPRLNTDGIDRPHGRKN
jgi:hypothetical protein